MWWFGVCVYRFYEFLSPALLQWRTGSERWTSERSHLVLRCCQTLNEAVGRLHRTSITTGPPAVKSFSCLLQKTPCILLTFAMRSKISRTFGSWMSHESSPNVLLWLSVQHLIILNQEHDRQKTEKKTNQKNLQKQKHNPKKPKIL